MKLWCHFFSKDYNRSFKWTTEVMRGSRLLKLLVLINLLAQSSERIPRKKIYEQNLWDIYLLVLFLCLFSSTLKILNIRCLDTNELLPGCFIVAMLQLSLPEKKLHSKLRFSLFITFSDLFTNSHIICWNQYLVKKLIHNKTAIWIADFFLHFKGIELYWGAVFFSRSVQRFSLFLKSNWSSDFGHAETRNGERFCGMTISRSNFKVEWESGVWTKNRFLASYLLFACGNFTLIFTVFLIFFIGFFFQNGFPNPFEVHSRPSFLLESDWHFSLVVFTLASGILTLIFCFFCFIWLFFRNEFPISLIVHSRSSVLSSQIKFFEMYVRTCPAIFLFLPKDYRFLQSLIWCKFSNSWLIGSIRTLNTHVFQLYCEQQAIKYGNLW